MPDAQDPLDRLSNGSSQCQEIAIRLRGYTPGWARAKAATEMLVTWEQERARGGNEVSMSVLLAVRDVIRENQGGFAPGNP